MHESPLLPGLHRAVLWLLPLSLFLLLAVVVLLFLFDAPDEVAEYIFRSGFALFTLALLGYASMQWLYGLRQAFSMTALLYSLGAALLGLALLKIVVEDPLGRGYLLTAAIVYGLLALAAVAVLKRHGRRDRMQREQDNDPGVRGSVSIFQTGSQDYRLVRRHADPGTEASHFQTRLLRYIERKTGRKLYAFSGDGCDYWKLADDDSDLQLMVIGPGFNTRSRLRPDNPWILRIRESAPWRYSKWLEAHFPEGCGRRRELPGGLLQTQLSARCLGGIRDFFAQDIEPPHRAGNADDGLTPQQALLLIAGLRGENSADEKEPEQAEGDPRVLH